MRRSPACVWGAGVNMQCPHECSISVLHVAVVGAYLHVDADSSPGKQSRISWINPTNYHYDDVSLNVALDATGAY